MHTIRYLGPILFSVIVQNNVQAQNDLSATLTMAEKMRKIMYENYETSHTVAHDANTDSLSTSTLNGQHSIRDKQGKIVKEGDFRNGVIREGFFYKYNDSGTLLEKHIYKNGRYITKETL